MWPSGVGSLITASPRRKHGGPRPLDSCMRRAPTTPSHCGVASWVRYVLSTKTSISISDPSSCKMGALIGTTSCFYNVDSCFVAIDLGRGSIYVCSFISFALTPQPHHTSCAFLSCHSILYELVKKSTPAVATSTSCGTVPPLTPMAPSKKPSLYSGSPPPKTTRPPFVSSIPVAYLLSGVLELCIALGLP